MASGSTKAINSFLDLFSLNASDVSTINGYHVPIFPTVSLKEVAAPLEFSISGVTGVYLNLFDSFLKLDVSVKNADGSTLAAGTDVSCSNLLLSSLFDLVEIYMNGKLVSAKQYYHYCAFIISQLSHSQVYKDEVLRSALYIRDVNCGVIGAENTGYLARKTFLASSQNVELCGKIMDDICLQSRWILPLVDIKIKLRRAPVRFTLLSPVDTTEYKIEITSAVFYCKNQIVSPKVIELHEKALQKSPALYPFIRNEIKCVSILKSTLNSVTENIFSSNQLPQRIVVGFVETDSLTGKYSKNGYNFANYKLTKLSVSINNVPLEYRTLDLSFNTRYLLAYQQLVDGLNLGNTTNGITRDTFTDGNNFFIFQLQSFESEMSFYPTNGNLKLELTFGETLATNVTAVILAQTVNLMTIDKFRNIEIENQGVLQ